MELDFKQIYEQTRSRPFVLDIMSNEWMIDHKYLERMSSKVNNAIELHLFKKMEKQANVFDFENVVLGKGEATDAEAIGLPIQIFDDVAVVRVSGVMLKNQAFCMEIFGGCSTKSIDFALKAAVADDSIRRIQIIMETPGGMVDGAFDLADTIRELKEFKDIDVHIDGLGASAGYLIASQATSITATQTAAIGSIGVITQLVDDSQLLEDLGVKIITIKSGEFKAIGSQGTEITNAQIDLIRTDLMKTFDKFLDLVVEGRGIDREALIDLKGQVLNQDDALDFGLIDSIGRTDQVLLEPKPKTDTRFLRAQMNLQEMS